MNKVSISVVINTLNEEKNIKKCIQSAIGFADEILVCDMKSEDNTVKIAESLGARVVFHRRERNVEPARYFAISSASGEWIMILDADESLTPELKIKLKEIAAEGKADLVKMGVLFYYFTKYVKHGGFYNQNYPRFFRKELYFRNFTHENNSIFKQFAHLSGNAKEVEYIGKSFFIVHDAYPSIEKYVIKTEGIYALIEAETLFDKGKKFSLFMLLFDPAKTFIKKYFFQKGFLEGINGFILCILYSCYRFNVWSNLWWLEKEKSRNIRTF